MLLSEQLKPANKTQEAELISKCSSSSTENSTGLLKIKTTKICSKILKRKPLLYKESKNRNKHRKSRQET